MIVYDMLYYSVIVCITIALMMMMVIQLKSSNIIEGYPRTAFYLGFTLIIVTSACEWLTTVIDGMPFIPITLHALLVSMLFTLSPVIVVAWLFAIGKFDRIKQLMPLLIVNCILEILSAFYGFIFYIDEAGCYYRGDFYWLYIIVYGVSILIMFWEAYHFSKKYQNRGGFALLACFFFLTLGITATVVNVGIRSTYLIIAICSVMFYMYYVELVIQTDPLTSLLNRRSYKKHLADIDYPTAIIILDIDNFKNINDTYGHAYGDVVLKKVSHLMVKVFQGYGYCYRIGGDEFCIILKPTYKDKLTPTVRFLYQRFDKLLNKARLTEPQLPTVSIGHELVKDQASITNALQQADEKMYETKRSKKGE